MSRKKLVNRVLCIATVVLSLLILLPMVYAQVNQTTFNDIIGHWAKPSIEKLASLGIIGGYPDGTFKPDQAVTRGEVTTMIDRVLEQPAADLEKIVEAKLAAKVAFPIAPSIEPKRGCPSCHVLVDTTTGKYTLGYEAYERAEARGREHPQVAPDGTSLAPTNGDLRVTTCLLCHAPGSGDREGKGVVAPLALRDIVHPAHMGSQAFKVHYGGSCFTCHNVDGQGTFELLTEAVDTNDKGVPNPEKVPIPGAIQPSQK